MFLTESSMSVLEDIKKNLLVGKKVEWLASVKIKPGQYVENTNKDKYLGQCGYILKG